MLEDPEATFARWFARAPRAADAELDELAREGVARMAQEGEWVSQVADTAGHEDLALLHDLYRDIEPADVDATGRYSSIRFNLWTSVDDARHSIAVDRREGAFHIWLGQSMAAPGLEARTMERQESRRLEKLIVRDLRNAGFDAETAPLGFASTLLKASARAASIDEAMETVNQLAKTVLNSLGLEAAVANLAKARGNAQEILDEETPNFIHFNEDPRPSYPDCVFLTELTTCPRCRSKWPDVVLLTRLYPTTPFWFVFLNKSRAVFKEKVFRQECPEVVRAGQVAPMLFFVKQGRIVEVLGTTIEAPPPPSEKIFAAFERHFAGQPR